MTVMDCYGAHASVLGAAALNWQLYQSVGHWSKASTPCALSSQSSDNDRGDWQDNPDLESHKLFGDRLLP